MDAFLKTKKLQSGTAAIVGEKAALTTEIHYQAVQLKSDDTNIQSFYDQLTENEAIAHKIAVLKLGTSYDVVRTHGYLKWLKSQLPK